MLPVINEFEEFDCEEANDLAEKWSPLIVGRNFKIGLTAFTYTSVEVHNIEQKAKCYVVVLSDQKGLYIDLRKVIFDDPYLKGIYLGLQDS